MLKVADDQYDAFGGRFGHLFYQTPFSHYLLRIEYRFVGVQVAGGSISLQSESHPIEFRRVVLKRLEGPAAK